MTMVNPQQQQIGFVLRYKPYAMSMDRERNCYNCEGFGHITRHCRERENLGRIGQGRRMNYEDNSNTVNNLNGKENLIVLD